MSAYKQFNSQDLIISPLEVNKSFHFVGGDALTGSDVGIDRFLGSKGDFLNNRATTGKISGQEEYKVLLYNSVKQLYYSNYLSGSEEGHISNASTASFNTDGTITGPLYQTSYYNYEQNTVYSNKSFPTSSGDEIGIISIPSKLYGDYIQPNSFILETPNSGSIKDDGNGRLFLLTSDDAELYVGNIVYQHGLAIITKDTIPTNVGFYGQAIYGVNAYGSEYFPIEDFINLNEVTCSFSSSYELFETQYKVTVNSSEFNYSQNPTVLSGSQGDLYPHFTGSYFDPYVTTVGLYSPNYELLAIGKLAKPFPTSRTTDTTILINIDR
jgi:hypothetical protein